MNPLFVLHKYFVHSNQMFKDFEKQLERYLNTQDLEKTIAQVR